MKAELQALIEDQFREIFYFHHHFLLDAEFPGGLEVVDLEELEEVGALSGMFRSEYLSGMREMLTMPLASDGGLVFFSDRRGSFTAAVFPVARVLAGLVSLALKNEKMSHELAEILQGEAGGRSTYGDIVGRGPAMQAVFELLSRVSFADSTVLVLGETGTGKELVARAIHHSSPRKDKLMVKVNCAALPANLIESELFGHEKGSFTGATDRRIGKFELANNGTLFLDEIGEMPADLQVKLLRALQEKEIERIGGRGPIKVNVRIIAATNRNLQHEVDEGRFRRDLYYRLNVFPIHLPPLRGRREDIPALVMNFVEKFSKNAGKRIGHVSGKAMKELMAYDWPGNVRELEHLIERSVLLAKGDTIRDVHLPGGGKGGGGTAILEEGKVKTFEENEREHILRALKRCNGKVYGPGGAAELLGLNSSTLNSKIRKLGIQIGRTFYKK